MKKLSKTKFNLILFFLISYFSYSQSPTFEWVNKINGGVGNEIVTDNSGNIYVTGEYNGTVDFSPNGIATTLTSSGYSSSFVAKYDKFGVLVWTKSISGTYYNMSQSIKIDGLGNVYIVGNFNGTTDFDPGNGSFLITSNGNNLNYYDMFICKLNNNGDFIWAKTLGNDKNDIAFKVAIDQNNNPIIIGNFTGIVDFDPNNGVFNLSSQTVSASDIFIWKLNGSGELIWAKVFGGEGEDYGRSISIDNNGNIITTGAFNNWADFDGILGATGFITTNGIDDAFVCKHDSLGNFIWVRKIGGTSWDMGKDLTIDLDRNIYVTGSFYSSITPIPGLTLNAIGSDDLFICKLNENGDIVWAKSGGGTGGDALRSIVYKNNCLYLAGDFYNQVDFDFNAGTYNLTSTGNNDIFISKITDNGDFIWAKKMGGSNGDLSSSITVDNNENIILTGFYSDYGDFKNGAKKSAFGNGLLIEKFSQTAAPLPINLISFEGLPKSNYNQISWSTATETNNAYFSLEKSEDGMKWLEISRIDGEKASNETKYYEYNDYSINSLSNYYKLKQVDLDGKMNYSKIINIFNTNFENKAFSFYPNPTKGLITIENPTVNGQIEMYDIFGKKIREFSINLNSSQINLSEIPAGTYFLSNKTDVKKVILE